MTHEETIKIIAHIRPYIELVDERQHANKSKDSKKVVLHVESILPPTSDCAQTYS